MFRVPARAQPTKPPIATFGSEPDEPEINPVVQTRFKLTVPVVVEGICPASAPTDT